MARQQFAAHNICPSMPRAFDRLPVAVALLEADASVLAVNSRAQALMGDGDGLEVVIGRLMASRPDETVALHRLIRGAAQVSGRRATNANGAMRISRPSGNAALEVTVRPFILQHDCDGLRRGVAAISVIEVAQEAEMPAPAMAPRVARNGGHP